MLLVCDCRIDAFLSNSTTAISVGVLGRSPSTNPLKALFMVISSVLLILPELSIIKTRSIPHAFSKSGFSVLHVLEHPSPLALFPSSHCSPDCLIPSPQNSTTHCALQPSPETVLLSSHCSSRDSCTTPSPQISILHKAEQPSSLFVLPSSHCSFVCFIPSPHKLFLHSLLQLSVLFVFPSSHCSSNPSWGIPSPQNSSTH